jgi:AbrB family looped-hinge helix DNA binding protein
MNVDYGLHPIDRKFRLVIPKKLRKILKWRIGDSLELWIENGWMIIEKSQN